MSDRRAAAPLLFTLALAAPVLAADGPRVDQIQVIGSHNSYHLAPHPNVPGILGARGRVAARALDYTHRPLAEQFSKLGVRQVEIDVFADPQGGRYARPVARKILKGLRKEPGPDPNADGRLDRPGFKVLHIQDFDYLSTVPTFAEALRQVCNWSAANPGHVPILVLVELKDEPVAGLPTRPLSFGRLELDGIDAEIRRAFSPGHLLTPDDVRGRHPSLRDAIRLEHGWPSLEASRGKIIFGLDNDGPVRDLYLDGRPSLEGRAMFASTAPDHPSAAWMVVNDPVADFDRIQSLVRAGFLVRTRADADTVEARNDDPTRREKALASGAQYVSTDFPEARPELSGYRVRLPGDVVARSNPVSGDPALAGPDLELARPSKALGPGPIGRAR